MKPEPAPRRPLWALAALAFAALFGASVFALAQTPPPEPAPLPVGLSNREVAVTSDYRGETVPVYGVNPPANRGGDIVIVLRGPDRSAVVMRKRRMMGLWVNGDPVRFSAAPSFFAVHSTRPLSAFVSPAEIWRHQLNPAALARLAGATPPDADPGDYRRALVRLKTEAGLYRVAPGAVGVKQDLLFETEFAIPANAPIGEYSLQTLVFRNGILISRDEQQVMVDRRGIERRVYEFAIHQSFFYGLLTVALALASGWAAAMVFRRS